MERSVGMLKPFMWMASRLIGAWESFTGRRSINTSIAHDLKILYPEQELQQLQREFRVKRLGITIAVLCVGLVCTLLVFLRDVQGLSPEGTVEIVRGDYGNGMQEVVLEVQYGEQSEQMELSVAAREYTREEIQQLAEEFMAALPKLVLQENISLEQVVSDLYLAESYEGYPFWVSWYSNGGYLDRTGTLLREVEQPTLMELELVITYEDMEWEKELEVTLLPTGVSVTAEEELREYLEQSELVSRSEAIWELPVNWKGQPLEYRVVTENTALAIGSLFVLASVLVFVFARKDLHRRYLDRQQELKASYPELVYQLTLYLGAGMTIRGSLMKIYETYENNRKSEGDILRAAFEEVGYVCRELSTGVAEVQAYESWGRRTGLPEYIQLCTLLTQNLQKGSTFLVQRLREENMVAQREYLRYCKRIGEEAQTKLLVPLVLMLVVVMLLILIPAFSMAGF